MTYIDRFSVLSKLVTGRHGQIIFVRACFIFSFFFRLKDAVPDDKLFETFTKHRNTE